MEGKERPNVSNRNTSMNFLRWARYVCYYGSIYFLDLRALFSLDSAIQVDSRAEMLVCTS